MPHFIKKILFIILIFASSLLIILYFINDYHNPHTRIYYTLKSYKNTVALYKNEEIIKIYNHIVLNTLPERDVQNFNKGISVTTPTQAESYLEDFDG